MVVGSDVIGLYDDVKAGKRYVTQAWRDSGWTDHPLAYFQPSPTSRHTLAAPGIFFLPLPRSKLRQSVGSAESKLVGLFSNRI